MERVGDVIFVLFTSLAQLVKYANFRVADHEAIWAYFAEVIAPYVVKWQGQSLRDQRSLGDTVLQFAEAAPCTF